MIKRKQIIFQMKEWYIIYNKKIILKNKFIIIYILIKLFCEISFTC